MSGVSDFNLLVSLSDVAKVADVSPSAVSNWRKRYEDFPSPRIDSGSGSLFDLGEVEAWLITTGRLEAPVGPGQIFENLLGALRSWASPLDISRFATAALVYFEACRRSVEHPDEVRVAAAHRWEPLSALADEDLLRQLVAAAEAIENANPTLAALLVPGLGCLSSAPPKAAADVLRVLEAIVRVEDDGGVALFEQIAAWRDGYDRFQAQSSTPDDLAEIMARVAFGLGPKVFDPAAGDGGVLLLTAVVPRRSPTPEESAGSPEPSPKRAFIAYDLAEEALRQCRSRFFVYGEPLEWRQCNSLSDPSVAEVGADVVVLDPPYGMKNWADAALYKDPRWTYGSPPFSSADFAWLQVALSALSPGGVAFVVLPATSITAPGAEGEIRRQLVADGVVEVVVRLPPRLRRDTSIPLALWVLRRRDPATTRSGKLLFVDGSSLGTPGREQHTIDEDDIDDIAHTIAYWLAPTQMLLDSDLPIRGSLPAEELSIVDVVDGNLLKAYRSMSEGPVDVAELQRERARLAGVLERELEDASRYVAELLTRTENRS